MAAIAMPASAAASSKNTARNVGFDVCVMTRNGCRLSRTAAPRVLRSAWANEIPSSRNDIAST
jgi:uncharacterized caspase-like protein